MTDQAAVWIVELGDGDRTIDSVWFDKTLAYQHAARIDGDVYERSVQTVPVEHSPLFL